MAKRTKKIIIAIVCVLLMGCFSVGAYVYLLLFSPVLNNTSPAYIYIDRDDNTDSVYVKIRSAGAVERMGGFSLLARYNDFERRIHTGKYQLRAGGNMVDLYRDLVRGQQTPVRLTIPSARTIGQVVKAADRQLMIDSVEIMKLVEDTLLISQMGFNAYTLPALFVPETYEVYWNISAEALMKRLKQEYDRFWNEQRRQQAKAIGLTPIEVATLASIVDEETAKNEEKPVVAGLYINRLQKGMLLQADPTVKFAMHNPALKRILFVHLEVDSPYNTYKHEGLPPGPIRIPSVQGIESVLNYTRHQYLYMCAKEDFSGYHNFAETSARHAANARRYQQALNRRGIR